MREGFEMVTTKERIERYIKMSLTSRFIGNLECINSYGIRQFPITKTEIGFSGVPRTPEDVADTIIEALDSIHTFGPYESIVIKKAVETANHFKQQEKRNARYSELKIKICKILRGA
jgi:hypothetical protein